MTLQKLLNEIKVLKYNIKITNHYTISQIIQLKEDKSKLQGIKETVDAVDMSTGDPINVFKRFQDCKLWQQIKEELK